MVTTPLLGAGGGAVLALVVALPRKRRGKPFRTSLALKPFEGCSGVVAVCFLLVEGVRLVPVRAGTRRGLAAVVFARVRPVFREEGKFEGTEFTLKGGWGGYARRVGVRALVFL